MTTWVSPAGVSTSWVDEPVSDPVTNWAQSLEFEGDPLLICMDPLLICIDPLLIPSATTTVYATEAAPVTNWTGVTPPVTNWS